MPLPWLGGDRELASINFLNPLNWFVILHFLWSGCRESAHAARQYNADRLLCMWAVPSGVFGFWTKRQTKVPYDVWALGSDIWRIRKLPGGRRLLRWILSRADGVFADGMRLKDDVEQISGRECKFLPSARKLPPPQSNLRPLEPATCKHFLYVGRYHRNKGPDILIQAVAMLPEDAKRRIRVHMFGVGPLKQSLVSEVGARQLGNVVEVGGTIAAQELSNFLSRCAYMVIPSRIESIPVALSDAVQSGVPVLVTNVGDMGDLVNRYAAGIVIPNAVADQLAASMVDALSTNPSFYKTGVRQLASAFDVHQSSTTWQACATQAGVHD